MGSANAWLFRVVKSAGLYPLARALRIWVDHHTPWGVRRLQRLQEFYSQFLDGDDLCFDIGANVGDRAELFLGLGARVVCVEPQVECVKFLQRRFRKNGSMVIVHSAAGAQQGAGQLRVCDYNPALSTLTPKWTSESRYAEAYDWARTEEVPVTTLDALIAAYGTPRFCKIDVEGGESDVLRGLSQPIRFLSFEFRVELLEDVKVCTEHLASLGTVSFNFTKYDGVDLLCAEWESADRLFARLQALNDGQLWGDVYARFEEAVA